ncbi:MAG TPA: protein-L-isoaspartate(D-aspartate) O-methyltransferase [Methanomicrobiales archaeon]|nr:protein-L-isoaspartate(D-aspartate) O-methyltransferase [Methanomicrobiales archaeon]
MEADDPYQQEREKMVKSQIKARGVEDPAVLEAFCTVPRHLFVPPPYSEAAYQDHPLPIGEGQTISQPYIVALMTELLELSPADRVLEIGSGSGYQAAILAHIVKRVITIERIAKVASMARENLEKAGIHNVEVIVGDGTLGYPPEQPYDGIIITAATPEIPEPLLEQLAEGGRLVSPVGGREYQELLKVVKMEGKLHFTSYGGVVFVPLIGEYGWENQRGYGGYG